MPTQTVSAQTMEIGKKGRGKHWTQNEIAARERAADSLKRKELTKLTPPSWLGVEALRIWKKKIKESEGVDLFDVLDEESLAVYCDVVVKYKEISKSREKTIDAHKMMQAYSRIIAQYADKLGFTPASRARLIKKRVEEKPDEFGKEFDR